MNEPSILNTKRLPARLNAEQTAKLLGFANHDIAVLMRRELLTPLGKPKPNAPKYFGAVAVEQLCQDLAWLHRATKAVSEHWLAKNQRHESDLVVTE